jgi:hypothetical protein
MAPVYNLQPIQATEVDGSAELGMEGEALKDLYNKILSFVTRECGLVLEATQRKLAHSSTSQHALDDRPMTDGQRQQFHLLGNVIWDEVWTRLASELGHIIFAGGHPDTFHRVRTEASF